MSKHPLYNETGLLYNNKPQVLYSLVNKRAELDGLRIETKNRLLQLEYELKIIDETIKIFDPDLEVEIKPKIPKISNLGNINYPILQDTFMQVLKMTNTPLLRDDIYEKAAEILEVDMRNAKARTKLKNMGSQILNKYAQKGIINKIEKANRLDALFELKRV
jgi:hypothetical protein